MLKNHFYWFLFMPVLASGAEFSADSILSFQAAENVKNGYLSKSELSYENKFDSTFSDDSRFHMDTRFLAVLNGNLEPGKPYQAALSPVDARHCVFDRCKDQFELREFYYRTDIKDASLILGKQRVVWGEADGVPVLDVVNPFSYREFILEEQEASRIPTWMANFKIPIHQFDIQLLWIFDQAYSVFTRNGAEFELTSPRLVPNAPIPAGLNVNVIELPQEKPNRALEDSDYGAKISTTIKSWDVSLNYLYYYDRNPVFLRYFSATPGGLNVAIEQAYERIKTFGGTASTSFNDFVFRSELARTPSRLIMNYDINDYDGVLKTSDTSYVLGLDYFGLSESFISAQLYQSILSNHVPDLSRPKADTIYTFLYRKDFSNQSRSVEARWLYSRNDQDGLYRIKLIEKPRDSLHFSLGIDSFYGTKSGIFGQFKRNDRVMFGVDWFF